MGHHNRWEALFYYFRLQDQVPETHLLRLSEKRISRNHNGTSVSIKFLLCNPLLTEVVPDRLRLVAGHHCGQSGSVRMLDRL